MFNSNVAWWIVKEEHMKEMQIVITLNAFCYFFVKDNLNNWIDSIVLIWHDPVIIP